LGAERGGRRLQGGRYNVLISRSDIFRQIALERGFGKVGGRASVSIPSHRWFAAAQ
jgi:hypothetical protein